MSFWFYGREHGYRHSLYSAPLSLHGMAIFVVIFTLLVLSFVSRLF